MESAFDCSLFMTGKPVQWGLLFLKRYRHSVNEKYLWFSLGAHLNAK